ncbi:MAG: iron ABC transporter permease, partial [Selenomonas sp.]|nr:iron ABC transporter permease [Selenomonas sp.]
MHPKEVLTAPLTLSLLLALVAVCAISTGSVTVPLHATIDIIAANLMGST